MSPPDQRQTPRRARPETGARSRRETLGRYELLFELARGGMGTVYVGRLVGAHGFDRVVAIKRLIPGEANASDAAALLSEARVSAQIHHPNVVQTLELGEHDAAPFVVMQLVQGVSLARLLRCLQERKELLDQNLAAWIVAQVATGLHAAHELKSPAGEPLHLVHRDVSPQNVLISFDGRVYVADFGIAKFKDKEVSTQSGVVKGKFAYMSPEQVRAEPLDRRSDVFAVGILLYEALTGRRLFAGESPAETILRLVESDVPSPQQKRPDLSPDLAEIALSCLRKRREDRFASAAAVAAALRNVLHSRHANVDEAELAALLGSLFPKERDELSARIREAVVSSEHDAPVTALPARHAVTEKGPISVIATIATSRWRRPAWPSIGVLGGLALVAVAVTWAFLRIGSTNRPTESGVQGVSSGPENASVPSTSPAASSSASDGESPPSASLAIPSPSAPRSVPGKIPNPRVSKVKKDSREETPPPAPPPSSERGRPFGTL